MNEDENALWRGFEARIERLEDIVRDLDETLRGDRRKKLIGLLAEQDRMDLELRKLNAVVFTDSTGRRGIAHDVDVLMERRSGKDRRFEFIWKYWIPLALSAVALAITVTINWDKIQARLPKYHPGPLEAKIDSARHPRSPKKIYRVRHVQEEVHSDDIKESDQN